MVYYVNHTVLTDCKPDECHSDWVVKLKDTPWEMSFKVLGAIIFGAGIVVFCFLVPHPQDVGLLSPNDPAHSSNARRGGVNQGLLDVPSHPKAQGEELSPLQALCIPGVIEFALCFFFAKFVSYTFLFWLPNYLESMGFDTTVAGDLSTIFDYGGIFGGIMCGIISDRLKSRAVIASGAMFLSVPAMYVYRSVVHSSKVSETLNGVLMFVCGTLINGVYALITTAVSADLGTHESLKGNEGALAMVTAIIDGTGSLGACITGIAISQLKAAGGYNLVFTVLEICAALAGLMLMRLVVKECKMLCGGGGSTRRIGVN